MSIRVNEDQEVVKAIREGLAKKGGYCPCSRDQIADPNFEGFCHCMLYYKSKD